MTCTLRSLTTCSQVTYDMRTITRMTPEVCTSKTPKYIKGQSRFRAWLNDLHFEESYNLFSGYVRHEDNHSYDARGMYI